jgi:transposase-like protein
MHEQHPVREIRLTRKEWYRLIEEFLRDGTIKSVARECGLALTTAQRCVIFLRALMTADVPHCFFGVTEADETYVGGAWKNKAIHIRKQGTKRGRGTQKQAIFGVVQRHPQHVRVWLVPNAKGVTLCPLICALVRLGSSIYTDGHKGYRRLKNMGYHHDWVDHDAGEYVRGDVHTQTLDGYWGLLKNHLAQVGGIRKKHLHLFIGEHVWRYNNKDLTRGEQTKLLHRILERFGGRF